MPAFGTPKVELHCHLLGVISPQLLREIQVDPLVKPDVLRACYPIHNLASFRQWIEVLKPYHSASVEVMRPILAAHVEQLKEQGVAYTEIMISPAMFPPDTSGLLHEMRSWREWALQMEVGQVQIEFLMVIPRTLAPEQLEWDSANFIRMAREELIAGVALVGPETGDSLQRFERSFALWRDAGLGIEVHAGEHSGPETVWDALHYARPHRLGHGLSAFRDPALLDQLHEQGIHLEFCASSNLRTGAVRNIAQHPIAQAREGQMSFSINTDDPGAFGCSMESEYQLIADNFGFTKTDFDAVFRNSLDARFARKLRHFKGLD